MFNEEIGNFVVFAMDWCSNKSCVLTVAIDYNHGAFAPFIFKQCHNEVHETTFPYP